MLYCTFNDSTNRCSLRIVYVELLKVLKEQSTIN